jgi:hypothetical protein
MIVAPRIRLLLFLWFAPIAMGIICAGYEFTVYRILDANHETAPAYLTIVVPVLAYAGAIFASFVIGRSLPRGIRFRRILMGVAGLLCFFYVWIRVAVVESAVIGQLGYSCCVEALPVWQQTILNVVNPAFGLQYIFPMF